MTTINERNSAWVQVTLRDKAGALAAPSTATYRIDCLTTGTEVKANTAIPSPPSQFEITLTDSDNAIIDAVNPQEYRRLTVTATYGAGDQIIAQFDYLITNLTAVI